MNKRFLAFLAGILVVVFGYALYNIFSLSSVHADEFPATVANNWFALQLELVEATPGFTPPVASRAFGYSAVALYESIVPGMNGHRSLLEALGHSNVVPNELYEPDGVYDWELVANSALAAATKELFANASESDQERIEDLQRTTEERLRAEGIANDVIERSIQHGEAVADAVLLFAQSDGGDKGFESNFPITHEVPTGDGLWVPTPPGYQRALQPYWGDNRYFVSASKDECELAPHPEYSTDTNSDFYKEALEVYETTGNLTEEENEIALFWADDPGQTPTPPGHWVSILTSILKEGDYSLADAAEIYARLGIALSDSFIACWREKYVYNLVRPITYIQDHIDSGWNTPDITDPVITPPFPEYPSGHSVQSGAAAMVLTNYFGENFEFTDTTHEKRGLRSRTYSSFTEASEEAAISRLYGGIHYRSAIEEGVTYGTCIGQKVNEIELRG